MERNSNNLKHHSIGGRPMKESININNNNKVKGSWEYCTSHDNHGGTSHDNHGGGDLLNGYLWNPRSYTCSFCRREFRSAQALGGHMNVHRRDRARLRQSPPRDNGHHPFLNLNLDPNPNPNPDENPIHNPNISFSSQSSKLVSTLPPLVSPSFFSISSPSSASPSEGKTCHPLAKRGVELENFMSSKALFGVGKFEGFRYENECGDFKKTEIVRLDLEIGLLKDAKEDLNLDLELRLGRS